MANPAPGVAMNPGQLVATVCALAALVAFIADCAPAGERTSLVLITIDTLRADHLEPYGYGRETTPFLRELADESFVFSDVISQCGTTPQSLSSLMTGLFPYTDGVVGTQGRFLFLERDNTTLAALLREQGYRTHAITASLQSSVATGVDLGFESFDGIDVGKRGKRIARRKADEIVDLALEWIDENAGSKTPFFLWLHFLDPHHPYTPPPGYTRLFADYAPTRDGEIRSYRFDEKHSTNYPLSDGELARMVINYDREIRYVDDALRRLLEEGLRPHLERTLLIFTADHGEALGNHGIVTHNDLYQSILRVPLLVRLPGAKPPTGRSDHPVMLVDLVPTALDWLGLPAPALARGTSLRPWLEGAQPPGTEARFRLAEYTDQALFSGRRKLITRGDRREFYDLADDPGEEHDLDGRFPELEGRLIARSEQLKGAVAKRGGEGLAPGVDVTPEMIDELRALGYVHEEDAGEASTPGPTKGPSPHP